MKRIALCIIGLICSVAFVKAQELNATVKVNAAKIQATNRSIFESLEKALDTYINGTKWSSANFARNERIDCTMTLTVNEYDESSFSFKTELFIQARRPVYNSSYITPTLNFRDTKLDFTYQENTPIIFSETQIADNLTAAVAFYCYMILALDFDSFSPYGGSSFFRTAQSIAMQAQSNSDWNGWSSFDDNRSRTSIVAAYTGESLKPLREYWYNYHRKSLDEMAANPDKSRNTILKGLPILKEIRSVRNSEIIIQMFADCKLDEIVSVASKASTEEKKETYDLLRNIFPASSNKLEPLKK